jgi:predicted DCC family thiol-disulfide oxidoreductase YuxK
MSSLTILYDAGCELCQRARAWMEREPAFVPLEFLPCASDEARRRFGVIPWLGAELVVVADDGRVWAGPAAFLTCLWALRRHREWSLRLASPELAPLAERVFHALSGRRQAISSLLSHRPCASDRCNLGARGPYR